jgi:glyoxylase-like metal-dependent hydrolase (beta-lactamase superfamily II)
MLKVHHLNCGSMCPLGGKFVDGFSHTTHAHLVCHCLAIETDQGIILVDTGLGTQDVFTFGETFNPLFKRMLNIKFRVEDTALFQLERLGFNADDVTDIVLTHLDFDHAGGLSDFPYAKVHVLKSELEAAMNPKSWLARNRYSSEQLRHINWVTYESSGEKWLGFECVRNLKGLPPEILLVPLKGHTTGHSGIAIDTHYGWLLHAGDAYFYRGEMELDHYHCTPGLRLYQNLMQVDHKNRIWNQKRLRKLNREQGSQVKIFSAHDAIEFENLLRESDDRIDFELFHLKEVNYPDYHQHY